MTKTAAQRRNPKHAPRLLYAMCKASQEMQASSGWLRLAGKKRNAELADALKAYAPSATTAHAIGPALKALVGTRLEHDGDWFELVERYFPGDAANRYGVRSPMRERIRKQRAKANVREVRIQADALEIAKQLRRGVEAPALVLPIASESAGACSRREALDATKAAGWFEPLSRSVREARELGIRSGWDLPPASKPVAVVPVTRDVDPDATPRERALLVAMRKESRVLVTLELLRQVERDRGSHILPAGQMRIEVYPQYRGPRPEPEPWKTTPDLSNARPRSHSWDPYRY